MSAPRTSIALLAAVLLLPQPHSAQAREPAAAADRQMPRFVYVQPWAYREFLDTGAFPHGTMFVLAFFEPSRKATPARAGFYEGDRLDDYEDGRPGAASCPAAGVATPSQAGRRRPPIVMHTTRTALTAPGGPPCPFAYSSFPWR
jgi:hypothetical protein